MVVATTRQPRRIELFTVPVGSPLRMAPPSNGARPRRGIVPLEEKQRRSWAQTYAETPYNQLPWFSPDPSPSLVRAVDRKWIQPPGPILDIGCGAGTNVLWLSGRGFRATGLDLAPGAIAAAKRRGHRRRSSAAFQEGSVLAMPFRKFAFRAALDNGCFHTLPLAQRGRYAAEVARVVQPGGAFLLTWIGREETRKFGPSHSPSLQEVAAVMEPSFVFVQTEFSDAHSRRGWGAKGHFLARYSALLVRRRSVQ